MMRLAFAVGLSLTVGACGGCDDPVETGAGGPVRVTAPEAKDSKGGRDAAYLDAYEQAVNEVTIDNARDRLEELNREIDEDTP